MAKWWPESVSGARGVVHVTCVWLIANGQVCERELLVSAGMDELYVVSVCLRIHIHICMCM